jgi:hypothetical protein
MLVAAKPTMRGSAMSFETRKLPLPPSHDAMEHIMRAVDCILDKRNDPYFIPTRTDIARLDTAAAALAYAFAITTMVKSELESRLVTECDELRRFRERYGMD